MGFRLHQLVPEDQPDPGLRRFHVHLEDLVDQPVPEDQPDLVDPLNQRRPHLECLVDPVGQYHP